MNSELYRSGTDAKRMHHWDTAFVPSKTLLKQIKAVYATAAIVRIHRPVRGVVA